jgi:hypothetical protein
MVHPILLVRRHIIPQELLDRQVDPLRLSIGLGAERNAHFEFRPHSLPQGSPKLTCELWVSIQHYVLWKTMVLKNVGEEQPPHLLRRSFIFCGDEVRHLAKSIHHNHDGIKSP